MSVPPERAAAGRVACAVLVAVLSASHPRPALASEPRTSGSLLTAADFPAAMVALPSGGIRFGERLTGRIREITPDGHLLPEPTATVAVSTAGQRGLLGLAVDARDRTFAAWTRPDRRLVVGQVAPDPARLVWIGPMTRRRANGGHLVLTSDLGLLIGIGDLENPGRVGDPNAPNGKILRLDPDGPPGQTPTIVSSGWNNPFAFTTTPSGLLWVADNTGRGGSERLARGDRGRPTTVTRLPGTNAPSGLAALDDGRLALCGFVSRRLDVYDVTRRGGARRADRPLATDCSIGVIRLPDGRLAYANETSIRLLRAPVGTPGRRARVAQPKTRSSS